MGVLLYGRPAEEIEIDDRTLAHLKIVILAKLRRGEPLPFSFEHEVNGASGRSTIWLHPTVPLQFTFDSSAQPAINRGWLERLIVAANSLDGLRLLPEDDHAS